MRIRKSILVTFCLILFSFFSLYGQEQLSILNTSWSNVIPGEVITEPAVTSYGFCVVTDGRMISAFSNNGVPLWEKPTSSSKDISITALPDDFILLWDNKTSDIKLLNPSGRAIWTKPLSYKLNKKPFIGRDGRLFISGDNTIECYGMNGICKWSLNTKNQKELPLLEVIDGSIILFLDEENGKTKALRISPFGKILEEITFSGEVTSAFTTKDGIFLIFSDGSSGLFSVVDGISKNKWVIGKKCKTSYLAVSDNSYVFLELYKDKVVVNKISYKDGVITDSFDIENINGNDLKLCELSASGLIIADSKYCYFYGLNGSKKWSAVMPEQRSGSNWNYVFFTNDNHLVFCFEDWSINAYLTSQKLHRSKAGKKSNYNDYFDINYHSSFSGELDRNIVGEKRYNELARGYYGEKEQQYTSDLYSILSAYLRDMSQADSRRRKISVFNTDAYGVECAFNQIGLYGTSDSASYIAKLLSNTTDKSYIRALLSSIVCCGYDPDGKILQILENKIPTLSHSNNEILKLACDAVSAICLFMGRPAFNTRGKEILKKLLSPGYDNVTRNYAIKTLENMINSGL